MSVAYKPAGYSSVAPYLLLREASQTIDFLIQVFDATELRRFPDGQGGIAHAEVRIDDSVLMLADSTPDWLPGAVHIHIYVSDVDASYQRALAAGAASVQEPSKKADADRRAGVRDSAGTTWWIATKVE